MSDDAIRNAERAYRASGAPQDGEAWVQAVLRTTSVPTTFLIARVIETQRALHSMTGATSDASARAAIARPVTPDDMVSFLRGGREWLKPPPLGQNTHSFMVDDHSGPPRLDRAPPLTTQVRDGVEVMGRNMVVRGVLAGDAILCNHANENPGHCPCEPNCYCRQDGYTCSDVRSMEPNDGTCEIRGCRRCPRWHFRTERGAQLSNGVLVYYVCTEHLAEIRANNSLSEMVRHHEAVDDV